MAFYILGMGKLYDLKDIVKEGAKLRNYVFYGVSSALHLCAAVMIVTFYILGCYKAATAIGAAIGIFWTIVLFLAYKKTKAEFDHLKKQIDE